MVIFRFEMTFHAVRHAGYAGTRSAAAWPNCLVSYKRIFSEVSFIVSGSPVC
jgi:hypothetical protein